MTDAYFDLNGNGPFYGYLNAYRVVQNWDNNTSTFQVDLYAGCYDNGWGTYGAGGAWSINTPGFAPSGGLSLDFRPAGSSARRILLYSGRWTRTHDSDGNLGAFNVSAYIDTDHNSIGDGGATVTEGAAPRIPKAPSKPAVGNASHITATSIRLNGQRPDDNGAAIDGWQFMATGLDGAPTVTVNHDGHILDIPGLVPGKAYRLQYRAHNSRGWSPWSDGVNARTISGAYRWNGNLWTPEETVWGDGSTAMVMVRNADNSAWVNAS